MSGWHYCADGDLPENNQECIVYTDTDKTLMCEVTVCKELTNVRWIGDPNRVMTKHPNCYGHKVVAWMEKPEPPQEPMA